MNLAKIFNYFLGNLLLLFVLTPLSAQEKAKPLQNITKEPPPTPLFQGLYVGTDLFGLGAYAFGTDYLSYEASLHANLKNKYFPVWEIGMGKGNTTTDIDLKLSTEMGLYNRIGLNYNMLNRKNEDFIFVGFRYGFSSFNYNIENIDLSNGYWPSDEYVGNPPQQSATVNWGEFLAGIQVRIVSNFYMGWSVRYKAKFSTKVDDKNLEPWYIPGYGTGNSSWGITYNLFYKIY